jgi:hypothetical protein
MNHEFSQQSFEKYSNIIFYEYPSIGSRVTSHGRTDRQVDMMKLIVAFRNFVNSPKNYDKGDKTKNLLQRHRLHELESKGSIGHFPYLVPA